MTAIVLPPDYKPSADEEYMNEMQLEYFRQKLENWKKSLVSQLKKADCLDRLKLPYHQSVEKCILPYTIGGGIGQSRVLMTILKKSHIAEVQASSWSVMFSGELKVL